MSFAMLDHSSLLLTLLLWLTLVTVVVFSGGNEDSFAKEKHLSSHPNALVVRFSSRYEKALELYWVPRDPKTNELMGREHEVLQKKFKRGNDEQTINTFIGHAFVFRLESDPSVVIKRAIMDRYIGQVLVLPTKSSEFIPIGTDNESQFASMEDYEQKHDQYIREYYDRTGRPWKNFWPRPPVDQWMYPTDELHQKHKVISHFPKWYPKQEFLTLFSNVTNDKELDTDDETLLNYRCVSIANRTDSSIEYEVCRMKSGLDKGTVVFPHRYLDLVNQQTENNNNDESGKWNQCDEDKESGLEVCIESEFDPYTTIIDELSDEEIEIEVLCHSPRVFVVRNILTDFECDHIIDVGKSRLKRSTVAESADVTLDRTSRTSWVGQKESEVIADVYGRVANILRMDTPLRVRNNGQELVEQLQLVHYNQGDLYKSHVDYETTSPHSRFITFLMYLNTPGFGGGNTSFPRAHSDCSIGRTVSENGTESIEEYFGLNPGRGSAVFFYNLLPDGNVDDKSLHYAEPPVNGTQKYMTNLWLWNPYFRKLWDPYGTK